MLRIEIAKNYKSIKPCSFELPDFSVLTGLNGSGKTHLLEAISTNSLNKIYFNDIKIENKLYIPFNGLNPNINESCDPVIFNDYIKQFYQAFKRYLPSLKVSKQIPAHLLIAFGDDKSQKFAKRLSDKITIPWEDVDENYLTSIFDISMIPEDDVFIGQFALIFKHYHKVLEENKINRYYKDKGGETSAEALSDTEFNERYGAPPWDFVNSILEEINLPYRVNAPQGRPETIFEFKLIGNDGCNISPKDLSTGEKVLMSLALAIYNTNGDFNKSGILLIDEPDAPLHPSMSKKMVSVLADKIVKDAKIPVLITSHSPTTIICCEGASIYKMERGISQPIKTSTQEAIELLSSDIPFLKISNDNRRQVFVESKNDVEYYELITNILSRISTLNAEPIYIAARTSNGSNSSDVEKIVESLYKNGNEQIYGIIDWDAKNISKNRVIVLGENERYSIENYILDPLLMGIFFLRESKITFGEMGLGGFKSYPDLLNDLNRLNEEVCQTIIDYVLTKLSLKTSDTISYKTYCNLELTLTNDFNKHQGHDLEELYKAKFSFLRKYSGEKSLKIEVINKVISDFPKLVPNRLYETILKII
jgi:predicted ATPase